MDGVGVYGRKGVGGLLGNGWMIQPLQEDDNRMMINVGMIFFTIVLYIFSPLWSFYPAWMVKQSPHLVRNPKGFENL